MSSIPIKTDRSRQIGKVFLKRKLPLVRVASFSFYFPVIKKFDLTFLKMACEIKVTLADQSSLDDFLDDPFLFAPSSPCAISLTIITNIVFNCNFDIVLVREGRRCFLASS